MGVRCIVARRGIGGDLDQGFEKGKLFFKMLIDPVVDDLIALDALWVLAC